MFDKTMNILFYVSAKHPQGVLGRVNVHVSTRIIGSCRAYIANHIPDIMVYHGIQFGGSE